MANPVVIAITTMTMAMEGTEGKLSPLILASRTA